MSLKMEETQTAPNSEDLENQELVLEENLKLRKLVFWIVFLISMLAIGGLIFVGGFF